MKDFDPADLDGDGEFDAIDISILEEEDGKDEQRPKNDNNGCCFSLTVIGLVVCAIAFGVKVHCA